MEAAIELSTQRGYHGTTLAAIGDRCGLTTGAVYSIFGSKQDLFIAALGEGWPAPRFADASPPGTPLEESLRRFGETWGRKLDDPRANGVYGVALEVAAAVYRDDDVRPVMFGKSEAQRDELARDIARRAREAGESLPVPAVQLATLVIAAMVGLAQMRMVSGQPEPPAFGAVAAALMHLRS